MEYAVSTNCLTKKFKQHTAVNQINLHVKKGEIYGFIGRNGAGKTTCMKMICGLSAPTAGEISLFGRQGAEAKELRGRIGNLIETPGLYPNMSAFENLKCKCLALGIHKRGYIEDILSQVGLQEAEKKKAKNFSLGMKQRLGIGMALLGEPDLLILDEPINGLDTDGMRIMREILIDITQKFSTTVLISSHILGELEKIATHYGIIRQGRMIQEISAKDMENRARVFVSLKTKDMKGAKIILQQKYDDVREEEEYIRIYDVDDTEAIVDYLYKNGHVVNEIGKNKIGLEEYYIELMSKKEAE